MSPIPKIVFGIYGGGICVSSIFGIREQNLKIEKYKRQGIDISYTNYAMESFGGFMIGGLTGLWWPATLIGRASVMFSPTGDEKK